jgi:cold shock CspA family protein
MRTGVVKTFRDKWGFLRPSGGGEDLFFHVNGSPKAAGGAVREGDEVTYTEAEDRKRPGRSCAIDVRPLEREGA